MENVKVILDSENGSKLFIEENTNEDTNNIDAMLERLNLDYSNYAGEE